MGLILTICENICFWVVFSFAGTVLWPLRMAIEEMRKEDRAEEKACDGLPINEGLFRRPVLSESGKVTLDALGLEGSWRCLMDG